MTEGSDGGRAHVQSEICSLCVAVADATRNSSPYLYNQPLMETDRFLVLPSLGPLMLGHVMVVGKKHQASLASMSREAVEKYGRLAKQLRNFLFFERTSL